jgi:hypothetical protein
MGLHRLLDIHCGPYCGYVCRHMWRVWIEPKESDRRLPKKVFRVPLSPQRVNEAHGHLIPRITGFEEKSFPF